jgi:hypothetical protein
MKNQEQSREEWEKELSDVQRNVTPGDDLRSAQIIAKRLSASPAPIADFAHLVTLLISGALLVGAYLVLSSELSHRMVIGLAVLAASVCLGIAAFWRRNKRG